MNENDGAENSPKASIFFITSNKTPKYHKPLFNPILRSTKGGSRSPSPTRKLLPKLNFRRKVTIDLSRTVANTEKPKITSSTNAKDNVLHEANISKVDQMVGVDIEVSEPVAKKPLRQTVMKLGDFKDFDTHSPGLKLPTKNRMESYKKTMLLRNILTGLSGKKRPPASHHKHRTEVTPSRNLAVEEENIEIKKIIKPFRHLRTLSNYKTRSQRYEPCYNESRENTELKTWSRIMQVNNQRTLSEINSLNRRHLLQHPLRRLSVYRNTKYNNETNKLLLGTNVIDPLKSFTTEGNPLLPENSILQPKTVKEGNITITIGNSRLESIISGLSS